MSILLGATATGRNRLRRLTDCTSVLTLLRLRWRWNLTMTELMACVSLTRLPRLDMVCLRYEGTGGCDDCLCNSWYAENAADAALDE